MKNIRELIKKALEFQQNGLSEGQIADELNVSRETATWLMAHSPKGDLTQAPKDIYVNLANIGRSAVRMRLIASALCDLFIESLKKSGSNVDVVVGVDLNGIPIATLIAEELEVELAVFQSSRKSQNKSTGMFSHNYAKVEGKDCIIVDDVITSGRTVREVISLLNEKKATPTAAGVLIDKVGFDSIESVPVCSLFKISRIDKIE